MIRLGSGGGLLWHMTVQFLTNPIIFGKRCKASHVNHTRPQRSIPGTHQPHSHAYSDTDHKTPQSVIYIPYQGPGMSSSSHIYTQHNKLILEDEDDDEEQQQQRGRSESPSISSYHPFQERDLPNGYELRLKVYRAAWTKCLDRVQVRHVVFERPLERMILNQSISICSCVGYY
jgi:hypothetical protein